VVVFGVGVTFLVVQHGVLHFTGQFSLKNSPFVRSPHKNCDVQSFGVTQGSEHISASLQPSALVIVVGVTF